MLLRARLWLSRTYYPVNNNLISQAATMKLDGIPNDVITNLNPFSLIILIPLLDLAIYPFMRRMRIKFTPIKKITAGYVRTNLLIFSQSCSQFSSGLDSQPSSWLWSKPLPLTLPSVLLSS